AASQQIWLPVPSGVDANTLMPYYYFTGDGGHAAWYPGSAVSGWLGEEAFEVMEADGQVFLGFTVNHSASVQLGVAPEFQVQSESASALPLPRMPWQRTGDFVLILLALGT